MKESISEEKTGVLPVEPGQQMFQVALFQILAVLRQPWKILKYRLKSGVCSFSLLEYANIFISQVEPLDTGCLLRSCTGGDHRTCVCWILNPDRIPNYYINRPRMAASLSQIFSEQRPFQPRMWKQPLSAKLCTCIILRSGSWNTQP